MTLPRTQHRSWWFSSPATLEGKKDRLYRCLDRVLDHKAVGDSYTW